MNKKECHSEEQCWIKYPKKDLEIGEDGQRRRRFKHYSDKNNWNGSHYQNHYGGRNNDVTSGTVDNNMKPKESDSRRNEHNQRNGNQLQNF